MKVIPDQAPRRDGFIEADGTWGEVTVGSVLAGPNRTEVWDVVDSRTPEQHDHAHTVWFLCRERASGREHAARPRLINAKVKFLLTAPDERLPAPRPLSDADEVEAKMRLLTAELGAQEIYTRDNVTGEIWCPHDPHPGAGGTFLHLRIAHGIDTAAMEAIPDLNKRIAEMHKIHGRAHSARFPEVKGGFAHRHVPEEYDYI